MVQRHSKIGLGINAALRRTRGYNVSTDEASMTDVLALLRPVSYEKCISEGQVLGVGSFYFWTDLHLI